MQKVCLDLHDFSVVHNRLDLLLKLKDHFPDFKVSMFTVAVDKVEDWGASLIREDSLKEIKKHLDWIQIIPHAIKHEGSEVRDISYGTFRNIMWEMENAFRKDGLPYEEGYCPPHWRWNEEVVKALDDCNWWGAIDRDKVMPRPKRFYQYNYLLNEPFPLDTDLRLHGHVYGTKNDLGRCFDNLMRLQSDTKFVFTTDCLEGIE